MSALRPICRRFGPGCLLALGLLAGGLLADPRPAGAQQPGGLYEVEIVVFRVASVGAAEDWSAAASGRGFGNDANRANATPPQVLRVLNSSEYRLAGVEAGLRSSGAWRPIAHAAWIQTAASWGTHVGIPLAELGVNVPELAGAIYLERSTYLHLGVTLTLTGAATYTIDEMRSVKYNDKQYFDHPAFGVIALVSPVARTGSSAAH
jgi:hypothetical protein